MDQGLEGIKAKINRADEHLNVLDDAISGYLGDKPYRFVVEEHTEGDDHHWAIFLEVSRFPPDEAWGPLIGDAVHNLRSALDHLAWQLAVPDARQDSPTLIEYPIFFDDPADNAEVRGKLRRKLGCLRPQSHGVIEGTQPYERGDTHHPLWLLQRLWNTDKHRMLHTAGFLFGDSAEDITPYGYSSWSFGAFDRDSPEGRTLLASGYGNAPQDVEAK